MVNQIGNVLVFGLLAILLSSCAAGVKVIGLTAGGHWHEKRNEKELLEAGAFAVTNDYKKIFKLIESI